jgi:hypothetical protein
VRHALADFTALALLPWAFWGLGRFIKTSAFGFLGPLLIAVLVLSSNPVALISFPFLIFFTIWLAHVEHSWKSLLRGICCLTLGLGLSAFFWLPALIERRYVHLERLLDGYLNYTNHFVYPIQLISSSWGYGISLLGSQDGMSFAVGPVHLLMLAIAAVIVWRLPSLPKLIKFLVMFSLAVFLLAGFFASTPSMFIWNRLPLLQYLEFPWRFLTLVAFSTALLCGFPIYILSDKPRLATSLTIVLLAGLFVFGFRHAKPDSFLDLKETDYTPQAIAGKGISVTTAEEYEPVWVQVRPSMPKTESLSLLDGDAQWSLTDYSATHYLLQVSSTMGARLLFNNFYFPGWKLFVNGVERPISYDNPQGVIEFSIEPGQHQVKLIFSNTPIRNVSLLISLISLALLLATLWMNKGKTRA